MSGYLSHLSLGNAEELFAFYSSLSGMRPEYVQLSAGKVAHRFDILDLGGVSVVKANTGGKTRWIDQKDEGDLHFAWVVYSDGVFSAAGVDIGEQHAMVWMPGQEMEYVMHGPSLTFEIGVSSQLLETLGWSFEGTALSTVNEPALRKLTMHCFALFERFGSNADETFRLHVRDQLLDNLERVLAPWLSRDLRDFITEDGSSSYRTIRQIDDFMREFDYSQPLTLDMLVQDTGVSRRSIHYAFRKHLNVTPRRYFELLRLHQLRHRLRTSYDGEITVAKAAQELHFTDPGRLPRIYKELFGEKPGDTLNGSN